MKQFKKVITLAIFSLVTISCGAAIEQPNYEYKANQSGVPYYRFWQGWKRTDLTSEQFLNRLRSFMPLTPQTHAKNGLVGYTVGIPPRNSAPWIADEFALVTYQSEAVYQRAKATPEGQKYAAAHWELFQRGPSKSAVPQRVDPRKRIRVQLGQAYDVLSMPVNWRQGYTTFYFGVRRKGLSNNDFAQGMSQHVELVKRGFYPQGMRGYVILVTDRYEIAYQNWASEAHFRKAMQSNAAKYIQKQGQPYLKTFMFRPAGPYVREARPNTAINFHF